MDLQSKSNRLEAIKNNRERISIISRERIIDELNKIILSAKPSEGFYLLEKTGLLELIFPELDRMKGVAVKDKLRHKDNFRHTLQVLDKISAESDNLWLRWAAIMHDIAKPQTRKYIEGHGWTFHGHEFLGSKMVAGIFRSLHLPLGASMKYVQKLVLLHLRPIALVEEEVTDSAVRRLLFEAGDDIDDLMMLCEADITSKNDEKVKQYLENFQLVRQKLKEIEEKDAVRNFQPPVDGELIMKTFKLGPCREVGIIKSTIKEAILEGTIHNNFNEAFAYDAKKADELGRYEERDRLVTSATARLQDRKTARLVSDFFDFYSSNLINSSLSPLLNGLLLFMKFSASWDFFSCSRCIFSSRVSLVMNR